MTDFENRWGEFKGWPDERRKAFLRRLIGVIGSIKPLAVGAAMRVPDHASLCESQKLLVGSKPYVWCAIRSAILAMKWVEQQGSDASVACLFEAGDEGSGEVLEALTVAKKRHAGFDRRLRLTVFVEKKEPPLQAADFFAYETAKQVLRNIGADQRDVRKSLRRLLGGRIADVVGDYVSKETLMQMVGKPVAVSPSDSGSV